MPRILNRPIFVQPLLIFSLLLILTGLSSGQNSLSNWLWPTASASKTVASHDLNLNGPTPCSSSAFVGALSFKLLDHPRTAAVADFNGDSKPDIVMPADSSNKILVMLGNGAGSFSPATTFATQVFPASVAVGDFNSDSKVDIVAANAISNSLSIFIGDGAGGFSGAINMAFSSSPNYVLVADFNRDQKADLAVTRSDSTIAIMLGNGLGSFATTTMAGSSSYLTTSDFNLDGNLDIAAVTGGTVSIFSGDGLGGFGPALSFTAAPETTSLAPADFNSDGKIDLAVSVYANKVAVLLNNGDGTFGASTIYNVPGQTPVASVAVGDFDNDGNIDFAGASVFAVSVWFGDGAGGFARQTNYTMGLGPTYLTVNDFNGDGSSDLVVVGYSDSSFSLLINDGIGNFITAPRQTVGAFPNSVLKADFNNDGKLDLATANRDSNNVSILLGDGTGAFAAARNFSVGPPPPSSSSNLPFSLAAGDFNGDNKTDLVTANQTGGGVSVLLGDGAGNFPAAQKITVASFPFFVAVGEFNSDGKQDLVVTRASTGSVYLLLGDGNGNFGAPATFSGLQGPRPIAIGDFNGDGKADIAAGNQAGANDLSVLLGNGAGGFGPVSNYPLESFADPNAIAIADFNGDTKPDLVVAERGKDRVALLLGNGSGGFSAPAFSSVGDAPSGLAIADFNGDGFHDVAVANSTSSNISLLLGNGSGGFSDGGAYFARSPTSVVAGDFNSDGRVDFATDAVDVFNSTCIDPSVTPLPALTVNDVSISEESGSITFSVALAAGASQPVTVQYYTSGQSAVSGVDFQSTSGSVTFLVGENAKNIVIPLLNDSINEFTERFILNLHHPVNAAILKGQGIASITDSDPEPTLSLNNLNVNEGNSGTTPAEFTIALSSQSGKLVSANYATADGTATSGQDYAPTSGVVTIGAGNTTKKVTVTVNGDTMFEQDETVFLNLSSSLNATIADSQGIATIINDDSPTGFIVNSTGDGPDSNPGDGLCNDGTGSCTLRAAIQEANTLPGAETITFAASVIGAITLNSALPDINSSVSIVGPGPAVLTVQRSAAGGTPNFRIFTINSGLTVSISGLTVTNGRSTDGTPGSSPTSGADGGGIFNGGTLTLANVFISGNRAGDGGLGTTFAGNGGKGGGIANTGTLTMTNCTVSGNSGGRGGDGGTIPGEGGHGGGIANFNTLTMTSCIVNGNSGGRGGDGSTFGGHGGNGGGIYFEGGTANAAFTSVTVSNNTAGDNGNTGTGGFGGHGGGLAILHPNAVVTMVNSSVTGNSSGSSAGTDGFGGGIMVQGTLSVTGSTISGNTSAGPGGGIIVQGTGIMTLSNSTVSGNNSQNGAGIYNDSQTTLTLANTTITGNSGNGVLTIAPATVRNSIIAGNGGGVVSDVNGPYNSQGHNLVGNADFSSGFNAIGDQVGSGSSPLNARLGPLANNGGLTQTHALLAGGPALDGGDNCVFDNTCAPPYGFSLTTDQRGAGFSRRVDGPDADATQSVDIGAFEAQVSLPDLADQTINEDGSLSLPFNVGGGGNITSVTASSSNIALVPNNPANISISGSGSTRTLTINPAADVSGTSTITLTVNGNNSQTMTDTFLLTVNSVNDAPSFSKGPDQTVNENTGAQTINNWASGILAGPADEAGQAVSFVVVNNSNTSLFAVTPAVSPAGALTYTPAAGISGTAVITIALMDNGGTANGGINTSATQTFNINVQEGGALQFSASTFAVAENGGNAVITVTRTGGTAGEARVNYAASNGTATAGQDYTATSDTLIFPEGISSKSFNVAITNDVVHEPDETINLTLTVAAGSGSLGTPTSAVLTITDNDAAPGISINDVSITEGDSGTVNASFNVTLSGQSSQTVTVDFATANGTATAGSDYQATGGTLTFLPLETTKPISVAVNGDTSFEANETFSVNLSNPVNATISDSQGTGTISNDDPLGGTLVFNSAAYTVSEADWTILITVNRNGDATQAVTVDYATSDVTADGRKDYTTARGTLRFDVGETTKTFPVLVNIDAFAEGSELAQLTLSNPTGAAALGVPATATLQIDNTPWTAPPANSIDDPASFVRQHYHDFLNREPDADGLAFWTNQITECQQPGATCNADVRRINVSAAFFLSIEFQQTGYLVERIYKSSYGDAMGTSNFGPPHQLPVPVIRFHEFLPDTQQIGKGVVVGAPGWEEQLAANKAAFVLAFVARARFVAAYPNTMTPAEFVDELFLNAGFKPSPEERTSVISGFGGAATSADTTARARALGRVAENPTLAAQEKNKAFVLMQYFGYLRRNPNDPQDTDYSGYDFWLTKLNEFNGNFVNAEMVKAFLVASEYRQRFGP